MRENVRDRDRLEHIVEAITNILDFADGKTKEQLEADKLRYFGIVKKGGVRDVDNIVEGTNIGAMCITSIWMTPKSRNGSKNPINL